MGSRNQFKDQPNSLRKKLLLWILYALLPIALIRLYFYPISRSPFPAQQLPLKNSIIITTSSSSSSPSHEEERSHAQAPCDYTNGNWVLDKLGPSYNGTTCGTIRKAENCIKNGRPDTDYIYWKWQPKQCQLPRFDPNTFLQLTNNKHIAFIGDYTARNQLESLLCMLATTSTPNLVYKHDLIPGAGEENNFRQFRKWRFPSHNLNISNYWSPFLVKGLEKSKNGLNYNELYLDTLDERWASDMDDMDMIVFSIGHWYVRPTVYFFENSVLGCHSCTGQNYTEIGFYDALGKAIKTSLDSIIERRGASGKPVDVIVTTFPPAHFEGEWDKFGACSKTRPYEEGEKQLEGMNADIRKTTLDELDAAKENAKRFTKVRLEAMDITKLSLMRPDGHPGPYWFPFPFANGISKRVINDCVHWCLPGPIDTWNEILLDMMTRWEGKSRREE